MPSSAATSLRHTIYALNLLVSTAVYLTIFFNTPLLITHGVPEAAIGFVYAIGSALSIGALFLMTRLINFWGNYELFVILSATCALSLLAIPFSVGIFATVVAFTVFTASSMTALFLLDVFLERTTASENTTGRTRAMFITMANIALVITPFVAGQLAQGGNFKLLYVIAGLCFFPVLLMSGTSLSHLHNHTARVFKIRNVFKKVISNPDLRGIFCAQFLLRIFYAIMVAFIPIYLLNYAHVSNVEMGAVLSFAMFAFLIVEIPAGKLSDTYWGEREMMVIGFLLMAVTTTLLIYISSTTVWIWALALFATRVGAALVDITSESYFFKHVDGNDADSISAFRILIPLSYIVGPIIGSVVLLALTVPYIFVVLGILMALGIPLALSLKDTR